jgi:prolyl 4-hydroxylase
VIKRDPVVRRIEKRAINFQGWRGEDTHIQPLKTQRYGYNGYFSFHYDWDPSVKEGNRVTTFMIYLVDECTGGGTNFPRLQQPDDHRWCDVIACDEDDRDGYDGVTFKPVAGSAIFWENMHPNGSFHHGVRHASLPVKSGEKVGLNIWTWDSAWKEPTV